GAVSARVLMHRRLPRPGALGDSPYFVPGFSVIVKVTPTGSAVGAPTDLFLSNTRTQPAASALMPLALKTSTPSALPLARTRNCTLCVAVAALKPPWSATHFPISTASPLIAFSAFGTSPLSNFGALISTMSGAAGGAGGALGAALGVALGVALGAGA